MGHSEIKASKIEEMVLDAYFATVRQVPYPKCLTEHSS